MEARITAVTLGVAEMPRSLAFYEALGLKAKLAMDDVAFLPMNGLVLCLYAGLADDAVTHIRRDLDDGAFILFHLDTDGRLLAASGIGRGNAIARDIRLAEMLIAARAHPDRTALAASSVKLKSLLAA